MIATSRRAGRYFGALARVGVPLHAAIAQAAIEEANAWVAQLASGPAGP